MRTACVRTSKGNELKRDAYLYVRQSTPRQVPENSESTKRQYALRQRAIALGWHSDHIIVIDNDLGQSGASAVDREGFKRLVAEVGMGQLRHPLWAVSQSWEGRALSSIGQPRETHRGPKRSRSSDR